MEGNYSSVEKEKSVPVLSNDEQNEREKEVERIKQRLISFAEDTSFTPSVTDFVEHYDFMEREMKRKRDPSFEDSYVKSARLEIPEYAEEVEEITFNKPHSSAKDINLDGTLAQENKAKASSTQCMRQTSKGKDMKLLLQKAKEEGFGPNEGDGSFDEEIEYSNDEDDPEEETEEDIDSEYARRPGKNMEVFRMMQLEEMVTAPHCYPWSDDEELEVSDEEDIVDEDDQNE